LESQPAALSDRRGGEQGGGPALGLGEGEELMAKPMLILVNPKGVPEAWPRDEAWSRTVLQAVLAWYFLRSAMGANAFGQISRIPNEHSRLQQAAKHEAEIYFDRMLEEGAWKPWVAKKLCYRSYSTSYGAIEIRNGWPVPLRSSHTGINTVVARFVHCALHGGKPEGKRFNGLNKRFIVPAWRISRQLREAVRTAGFETWR
jgi:hypothetical protein